VYLVGDADRERGLTRLRNHYADGRLTVEELDERVDVLARARTTRELGMALRDLPYGRVDSELVPRLVALRRSPVGVAVARRLARIALAAALLALWLCVSVVSLAALAVWQLAAGPSAEVVAVFALAWFAVTWLSWRIWRAGGTRRA
jgi:hypothetical protein